MATLSGTPTRVSRSTTPSSRRPSRKIRAQQGASVLCLMSPPSDASNHHSQKKHFGTRSRLRLCRKHNVRESTIFLRRQRRRRWDIVDEGLDVVVVVVVGVRDRTVGGAFVVRDRTGGELSATELLGNGEVRVPGTGERDHSTAPRGVRGRALGPRFLRVARQVLSKDRLGVSEPAGPPAAVLAVVASRRRRVSAAVLGVHARERERARGGDLAACLVSEYRHDAVRVRLFGVREERRRVRQFRVLGARGPGDGDRASPRVRLRVVDFALGPQHGRRDGAAALVARPFHCGDGLRRGLRRLDAARRGTRRKGEAERARRAGLRRVHRHSHDPVLRVEDRAFQAGGRLSHQRRRRVVRARALRGGRPRRLRATAPLSANPRQVRRRQELRRGGRRPQLAATPVPLRLGGHFPPELLPRPPRVGAPRSRRLQQRRPALGHRRQPGLEPRRSRHRPPRPGHAELGHDASAPAPSPADPRQRLRRPRRSRRRRRLRRRRRRRRRRPV
mmetsp:Transcript_17129/g.52043  ORF Transcript_17129/g.52043 Transcript_17129/m.52043 type:complete len:503 (-) Transcript_17129:116-1624(-)